MDRVGKGQGKGNEYERKGGKNARKKEKKDQSLCLFFTRLSLPYIAVEEGVTSWSCLNPP